MTIDDFTGEYFFLSNFYPEVVWFEGLRYPTNENAFQAAKTERREDRISFTDVEPAKAKRLGQTLDLRPHWDAYWRYKVMQQLIDAKFDRSEYLADKLRLTGDCTLIEGNTWGDQTWGMVRSGTRGKWRGHNILGWMLMEKREELRLW